MKMHRFASHTPEEMRRRSNLGHRVEGLLLAAVGVLALLECVVLRRIDIAVAEGLTVGTTGPDGERTGGRGRADARHADNGNGYRAQNATPETAHAPLPFATGQW